MVSLHMKSNLSGLYKSKKFSKINIIRNIERNEIILKRNPFIKVVYFLNNNNIIYIHSKKGKI